MSSFNQNQENIKNIKENLEVLSLIEEDIFGEVDEIVNRLNSSNIHVSNTTDYIKLVLKAVRSKNDMINLINTGIRQYMESLDELKSKTTMMDDFIQNCKSGFYKFLYQSSFICR